MRIRGYADESTDAGAVHDRAQPIVTATAHEHGFTVPTLLHGMRSKFTDAARADLYQRLREAGLTLGQIGRVCGRHHTTVSKVMRRQKENERMATTTDTTAPRFAQHKRSPKEQASVALCWLCCQDLRVAAKSWKVAAEDEQPCSKCGVATSRRVKAEDMKGAER